MGNHTLEPIDRLIYQTILKEKKLSSSWKDALIRSWPSLLELLSQQVNNTRWFGTVFTIKLVYREALLDLDIQITLIFSDWSRNYQQKESIEFIKSSLLLIFLFYLVLLLVLVLFQTGLITERGIQLNIYMNCLNG